jgi:hypothetical protein
MHPSILNATFMSTALVNSTRMSNDVLARIGGRDTRIEIRGFFSPNVDGVLAPGLQTRQPSALFIDREESS